MKLTVGVKKVGKLFIAFGRVVGSCVKNEQTEKTGKQADRLKQNGYHIDHTVFTFVSEQSGLLYLHSQNEATQEEDEKHNAQKNPHGLRALAKPTQITALLGAASSS